MAAKKRDERTLTQTELIEEYKGFPIGTPVTKIGIFEHPKIGHVVFPCVNAIKLILDVAKKVQMSQKSFWKILIRN